MRAINTPPLAWVTGASSGIGRAIAQNLLAGGWQVRGFDLQDASISEADYAHSTLDLTRIDQTNGVLGRLLDAAVPDALVHAAGFMHAAPLGTLQADVGTRLWALHVQAATQLADQVLPRMAARGRGRCVLVGSRVSAGMPGRSQYAATKAALVSLARSWAAEVVARGVTVNVVSPAATDTPMLNDPSRTSSSPRLPPIGRLIQPEEIAALAAFLLSDAAAAITGQDIAVCGGASLPK